ncbi:undecaprenyl/decaprenyl-phosphate alpha-N-acetylglucosaminyl 1-phosphate transferase [Echinicola strongylocentroti]|uniref:Undecaprenyl/decaprenyl-phosphate alpha-N-acetylglucosaminyl 1-phosphate transferase n=1 Tax=Echinicola strongylocentroti TaxID=1795355 RepID=A0A2Z4INW2_9BACT|nr:MraY family glycosyltransferase [Echinicola strongylocentroti]AWW32595.1 undecaprenyl/decaprenyl-phosphate alpha-N-acetylglucosaminyl 1-phosphate transferase [Echinicola strongylocentroti]
MQVVLTLILSFTVGLMVIPMVILWIKKKNILDLPGGRKIHKRSVPSMGGIGIMVAFFAGTLGSLPVSDYSNYIYFFCAVTILAFIGFWDDRKDMRAGHKLIGQLVAFFLVIVLGDIRIESFYGFLGIHELPISISYALSFFMLVGLTNSFNLIDGLDGLAGTLGALSCGFLGVWFMSTGFTAEGIICLGMLGSLMAFLIYNWHPAKVFMGDTGSLPIGCFIAVFIMLFIRENGEMHPSAVYKFHAPITSGLTLMVICSYDTLRVFLRRIRRGKSPFSPDKSHVHHFLMRMGYGHDQVAMFLGAIKVLFLGMVIMCSGMNEHLMFPSVVGLTIAFGSLINVVTLRRVREKVRKSPPISQRYTLKSNGAIKPTKSTWEEEAVLES